ncbi:MAG: hypothetical protein AAGA74_13605 [Pseudomonadota bacterium]
MTGTLIEVDKTGMLPEKQTTLRRSSLATLPSRNKTTLRISPWALFDELSF